MNKTSLSFAEYQEQANGFINESAYNNNLEYLINTGLGLTGESGEFADLIKKVRFHGLELSDDITLKLKKELGDVLWYIAQGCKAIGVSLEDIAKLNIAKLTDRHHGQVFNVEAGLNKDESKEGIIQ